VIIAGAGQAAHLAGAMAAQTTLPVIGVPIDSSSLQGLDALLSTVQMPPGIPVATVAIGKPGATNAGLLAVQILAVSDPGLAALLEAHKKEMAAQVARKAQHLKPTAKSAFLDTARPDPEAIDRAAALIRQGRVVVFPTLGFYGLGADPLNPEAVAAFSRSKAAMPTNPSWC
jgi:hypothetical protein